MANKKKSPVGEFLGKKHPEKIKKAVEGGDLGRLRALLQNLAFDLENLRLPQPSPEMGDFEGSMELNNAMAEIRRQIQGSLAETAKLDPKIDTELKKVERVLGELAPAKIGPPPPPIDAEEIVLSDNDLIEEVKIGTEPKKENMASAENFKSQGEGSGTLETLEDLVPKIIENELLNATLNDQSLRLVNQIGKSGKDGSEQFEIESREELEKVVRKTLEEYSETYGTKPFSGDFLSFDEISKWLLANITKQAQIVELSKNLRANLIENQREKNEKAEPVEQATRKQNESTRATKGLSEKFNRRFVNRLREIDQLDLDGLIQKLEAEKLVKRTDSPAVRRKKIEGVLGRWKGIRSGIIEILKRPTTSEELEKAVESACQIMDREGVGQLANYAYPGRRKISVQKVADEPTPELPPLPKAKIETGGIAPKSSSTAIEPATQAGTEPAAEAPKAKDQSEGLEKEWGKLIENTDENQKILYQKIKDFTKNNSKQAKAFIGAVGLLGVKADEDPELKKIQNKIKSYVEPLVNMPLEWSGLDSIMSKTLESLAAMDEKVDAALKQHKSRIEQLGKRDFLMSFSLGDLENIIKPVYEMLERNSAMVEDSRKKMFLGQVQKACQSFLEKIDIERLEKLELHEASEEAKKIIEVYEKQLKPHLEKYKTKSNEPKPPDALKGPEPPAPPVIGPIKSPIVSNITNTTKQNPAENGIKNPSKPAKYASSVSREPIPVPKNSPTIITHREKEAGLDKLDRPVADLLNSLLKKRDMVRGDDPYCLAIDELIREKGIKVEDLKRMLQNPTVFGKKVDESVIRANAPEGTPENESLHGLKAKYEGELEKVGDYLSGITGGRTSPEIEEKRERMLERKRVIKEMLKGLEVLIQINERTVRYDSPKQILAMILYDIEKDNPDFSAEKFYTELDRRVDRQREGLYSGIRSGINRVGFFLRPTLKSTLKALAEDRELKKIGEKPQEKLAELANFFSSTPEKTKAWVESLPGGLKAHVFTTVPRLIAYLEMAIRDGQISYLMRAEGARELVRNLKSIRNRQIQLEVEEEFEKNKNMKNRDLAYAYVMRLNEADRAMDDISRKYLKHNVYKSVGLKLGVGATAVGAMTALPILSALPAILSVPTFIASYMKSTPVSEENRPMMRRAAIRAFVANSLAIGGAALAAPLAIPMGVLGAFSPEIWKHRRYLFEKGGRGGKLAWEKGIKPGAPLVAKGVLGIFKWTVGLPFTLTYKAGKRLIK